MNYEIYIKPYLPKRSFYGNLSMYFKVLEETENITVNAYELKVIDVSVFGPNGKLDIDFTDMDKEDEMYTVSLKKNLTIGSFYTLRIAYMGKLRDDFTGFYSGIYEEEDEGKYFGLTRFEPTFARRAFPCMDEPEFKATFRMYITVPIGYTALSNVRSVFSE